MNRATMIGHIATAIASITGEDHDAVSQKLCKFGDDHLETMYRQTLKVYEESRK